MNNLSLLVFMLLLGAAFTSCLTDVPLELTEENEEVLIDEPERDAPVGGAFNLGSWSFKPNYAYLRTTPSERGGGFKHMLVMTQDRATIVNGDLADLITNGVIGIAFTSETESPEGNFPLLAGHAAATETGVRAAGWYPELDFSNPRVSLTDRTYDSGSLDIVQSGDEYKIAVDLEGAGSSNFVEGTYTGSLTNIILPEGEVVTEADFSGETGLTRDQESIALTHSYLVEYSTSDSGMKSYNLFITDGQVDVVNGKLTGRISSAMLFKLKAKDGLKSGRYLISEDRTAPGYFSSLENDQIRASLLCRDMNFDTRSSADDEPMGVGEALVLVEWDRFKIKFAYESVRGATVKGEYQGAIVEAR